MSNWCDKLEKALTEVSSKNSIPYYFERTDCEKSQLPDRYITWSLISAPPKTSADGKERTYMPKIQVSFFFREKSDFLTVPDLIYQGMIKEGFRRAATRPIPFQKETGHYGQASDFIILERR